MDKELIGGKTGRETAGEMFALEIGPLSVPSEGCLKTAAGEFLGMRQELTLKWILPQV